MADFLAVDLGATSGRVAIGRCNHESFSVEVVHRFDHEVVPQADGSLIWNWDLIFTEIISGLNKANSLCNPISLAVDSWAVDFGFIDGSILGPIHAYRDPRNALAQEELCRVIGKERIYSTTGIQFLPFNSIFQLYAAKNLPEYSQAKSFLLIPDLVNFLLTDVVSTEITNASSTQALNTSTRQWDRELIDLAGLRQELFTKLHEPGSYIGTVSGHGQLDGIKVVATASHDTAAAIASIPFNNLKNEGFISSGTWSLVGVEAASPVKTTQAFDANITNELGAEGTVRVLKNVTGMWLLEECRRSWLKEGMNFSTSELIELAKASNIKTIIDPNDERFSAPNEMPKRIANYCAEHGFQIPKTPGEFTFVIFNSLAHAYRKTIQEIEKVTDRKIETLHIIGGGSQNDYLNSLTSEICAVNVKKGAVEATLYGNIAIQAISAGVYQNLTEARSVIAKGV